MEAKSTDRLRRIWYGMIYRCHGSKPSTYTALYYRNKGIEVCHEWRNSFEKFKEWAVNSGYSDNLTIDRIDSDGNYCPENCQWLTRAENSKKANIEKARLKTEGHPHYGLWMVAEKIVLFRNYATGRIFYGYKVLETGLYKSEAISRAKELNSAKPWNHTYCYSPTKHYCVGDIANSEDIGCFLKCKPNILY